MTGIKKSITTINVIQVSEGCLSIGGVGPVACYLLGGQIGAGDVSLLLMQWDMNTEVHFGILGKTPAPPFYYI